MMPTRADRAIQRTGCNFLVNLKCVKKRMAAAKTRHGQLTEREKEDWKGFES